MNNKKIRVLSETKKIYRTIKLNIDDVNDIYYMFVDVKFIPYQGTIISKSVKEIRNTKTKTSLTDLEFAAEVLDSIGYKNAEDIKIFFKIATYWNKEDEYNEVLVKDIEEITIMFAEKTLEV